MSFHGWGEQFLRDIRFGLRSLAKSPSFALVAILSLALGIMASTAMYSVIHAVVLDPFPYKDVDSLMSVRVWDPGGPASRTYYNTDQFLEIAERNTIFEGTIASTISDVVWTGGGDPQRLRGNHVTRGTFEVMGVPPLLGRTLNARDFEPEAEPAVVLGYRFWQRQFGGDPDVLGRTLRLNDTVRTVVGIMPPRFMWRGADVYVPITFQRGRVVEGVRFVHLLGRLRPGVTEAQAEADLSPIIEDLRRQQPDQFPEQWRVGLLSFQETFPSSIREELWVLFGAVGLLLLIACANVSNLLLSKSTNRQREMGVRAALGAGRLRLLRQLLTESLVLAVSGGILGVILAYGALRAVIALVPTGTIPDESEIVINVPVLLFAVGISGLTVLIFGLAPALHASTPNLVEPLKDASRSVSGGIRQVVLRNGVVVAEIALALMLLTGTTLMLRTLLSLQSVDTKIPADQILTMRIPLPERRYPEPVQRTAFFRELLERAQSLPGIAAAAVNTGLHLVGNWMMPVEIVGNAEQDSRPVVVHQVSSDYTRALAMGLVAGRQFSRTDVESGQHLALVNESFAQRYLPESNPLGWVIRIPRLKTAPFNVTDDSFEIIGVVRDTLNLGLARAVEPEVLLPFTITGWADRLIIRAQGDPNRLVNAVRGEVYAIDSFQPVTDVWHMQTILDDWVFSRPRFTLILFAAFAGLGLVLAAIGVYGLISYSVAQRQQELGVRMALGAGFSDIVTLVVVKGFRLLVAGIVLGLAGAFAGTRLLAAQLWNVSPFDPLSFAAASLVLLAIGLQACLWPAYRAARVHPLNALRYE